MVEKTPANCRAIYSVYVTTEEYDKSFRGTGLWLFTSLVLEKRGQLFMTTCDGFPQAYASWLTAMDDFQH